MSEKAASPTCDFCGEPATKLVKRTLTNRTWSACDACCKKRIMSKGPYIVTTYETETRVLADDEILEALKECEFALQQVLRTEKVGWLQEEAHKTACAVLENMRSQKRKSANVQAELSAPIALVGRGSDGNAHIVYLSDGTKISVGRDRTTKGPAWLEISQQSKITAQ